MEPNRSRRYYLLSTTIVDGPWQNGTIKPGDYTFKVKIDARPSPDNLAGGLIAKLSVYDSNSRTIIWFDRAWKKKPSRFSWIKRAILNDTLSARLL
jgi:hypothetical protein